jgi:hypothetical protein
VKNSIRIDIMTYENYVQKENKKNRHVYQKPDLIKCEVRLGLRWNWKETVYGVVLTLGPTLNEDPFFQ